MFDEVVEVRLRKTSDLKEAVDRTGFEWGKPVVEGVTEAWSIVQLARFERSVFGIGVAEELAKTLLVEGDIDSGYSGHFVFELGLKDIIPNLSRRVGGSDERSPKSLRNFLTSFMPIKRKTIFLVGTSVLRETRRT